MSLNRNEQRVFDYLHAQADELRHWQGVVRREVERASDSHTLTSGIERQLWRYYEERAAVAEPFRSAARQEGLVRTSMRNLAELLIRLWTSPQALPKSTELPYA
ncbi:MAG: hypothetical protein NTU80_02285 [Verrucomicrobia bacterium]|nr:hypothetical protein [Verrucomicrobiota bacterium]